MLAPVTHILPLTTVRRERLLPLSGRIIARMDQKVSPMDVVAEAHIGQQHVLLDVAHFLGVPSDAANKFVVVKDGDQLAAGQPVAVKKGLTTMVVKSPSLSRVVLVGGGQILLEVGEGNFELRAGIPGVVTKLIPERGVEITFNGSLIQGTWGNNRGDVGVMHSLISAPDAELDAGLLDVSLRGFVILAGHVGDAAVLQTANELPVRGLILSSLSPELVQQALQVRFPIIAIEGLGRRGMNIVAYKLLTTNAKREVALSAESYDGFSGVRPEVFIPLPVSQEPPPLREIETFAPGQNVRLCRKPHFGEIGQLANIRSGLTLLPSGLRAPAADVRLDSGEQITVPLVNLEVLG